MDKHGMLCCFCWTGSRVETLSLDPRWNAVDPWTVSDSSWGQATICDRRLPTTRDDYHQRGESKLTTGLTPDTNDDEAIEELRRSNTAVKSMDFQVIHCEEKSVFPGIVSEFPIKFFQTLMENPIGNSAENCVTGRNWNLWKLWNMASNSANGTHGGLVYRRSIFPVGYDIENIVNLKKRTESSFMFLLNR